MSKVVNFLILSVFAIAAVSSQVAPVGWINEFHYRNQYKDKNLFIEIVGPLGEEAWEYFVIRYQGRDGKQFKEGVSLSGYFFEPGDSEDHGFIQYVIPKSGDIRNGKLRGDALALVYRFDCVQFLCYGDAETETFMARSGPCENKTCTNVGVHEDHHASVYESIQMRGVGYEGSQFDWTIATRSPGYSNKFQTILNYTSSNGV